MIVPVPFLTHSVANRIVPQSRLFLAMKYNSVGVLKKDKTPAIFRDKRTQANYIKWLLENNWIGQDLNHYFIRNWNRIYTYYNLKGRTGIDFKPDHILTNERFKTWAAGAQCIMMINSQKKKRRRERKKTCSTPSLLTSGLNYYGVANAILAKELNVDTTYASKLKNSAEKWQIITTRAKYKTVEDTTAGDIRFHIEYIKKNEPKGGRYSLINGKLYEQLPDEITPLVRLKTKRSIKK